ncbi:unnamed protein product [Victoria cruziana]
MGFLSNNLLGILNFLAFLLSIPILAGGIWLSRGAGTACEEFLDKPLTVLGVFLLLLSLAGLMGACCRVNSLLWIYLFVMFVLIVLVFCFTVFALVVTNEGAGEAVSGRGYKDYRLGDYSNWLQKRVSNEGNWKRIESCLQDGNVCRSMVAGVSMPQAQFYAQHLSPIQSGCCKPPSVCNFTYRGPANWSKGNSSSGAYADPDCGTWNDDPNSLCFDCNSCKAGVIDNLKNHWKKVAVVNVIFLIFLVIVYSIGCSAFRSNRGY